MENITKSTTLENVMLGIFRSCDFENNGKVLVSKLIDFLNIFIKNNLFDLHVLQKALDPNSNNSSIENFLFCKITTEWFMKLMEDTIKIWNVNHSNPSCSEYDKHDNMSLSFKQSTPNSSFEQLMNNCDVFSSSIISNKEHNELIILEDKITDLTNQNKKIVAELKKCKNDLLTIEEEKENVTVEYKLVCNQLKIQQQRINELKRNKEEEENVSESSDVVSELNNKIDALTKLLGKQQKNNSDLCLKLNQVEDEKRKLEENLEYFNKTEVLLKNLITRLKTEIDTRDQEIENLKENIDHVNVKSGEQKQLIDYYINENNSIKSEKEHFENILQQSLKQNILKTIEPVNEVEKEHSNEERSQFSPAIKNDKFYFYNYDAPYARVRRQAFNSPKLLQQLNNPVSPNINSPVLINKNLQSIKTSTGQVLPRTSTPIQSKNSKVAQFPIIFEEDLTINNSINSPSLQNKSSETNNNNDKANPKQEYSSEESNSFKQILSNFKIPSPHASLYEEINEALNEDIKKNQSFEYFPIIEYYEQEMGELKKKIEEIKRTVEKEMQKLQDDDRVEKLVNNEVAELKKRYTEQLNTIIDYLNEDHIKKQFKDYIPEKKFNILNKCIKCNTLEQELTFAKKRLSISSPGLRRIKRGNFNKMEIKLNKLYTKIEFLEKKLICEVTKNKTLENTIQKYNLLIKDCAKEKIDLEKQLENVFKEMSSQQQKFDEIENKRLKLLNYIENVKEKILEERISLKSSTVHFLNKWRPVLKKDTTFQKLEVGNGYPECLKYPLDIELFKMEEQIHLTAKVLNILCKFETNDSNGEAFKNFSQLVTNPSTIEKRLNQQFRKLNEAENNFSSEMESIMILLMQLKADNTIPNNFMDALLQKVEIIEAASSQVSVSLRQYACLEKEKLFLKYLNNSISTTSSENKGNGVAVTGNSKKPLTHLRINTRKIKYSWFFLILLVGILFLFYWKISTLTEYDCRNVCAFNCNNVWENLLSLVYKRTRNGIRY